MTVRMFDVLSLRAGNTARRIHMEPLLAQDGAARPGAPVINFVFTVCDAAGGETCPVWLGQPVTAHWGIPDPAAVEGPAIVREAAFVTAFRQMHRRIGAFVALPPAQLDRATLAAIGTATDPA